MTGARIVVVGVGRIGAVTAVGLAHLDHQVTGLDRDEARVRQLAAGVLPEAEPGLRAALRLARERRGLRFLSLAPDETFDFAFLCVDTPMQPAGEPDLSQVFGASLTAARLLAEGGVLVTRSTIPVGTCDRLAAALRSAGRPDVAIVHVPEFLREGRAWEDFRTPDRIVVGGPAEAAGRVAGLFASLDRPVFFTGVRTAELAKYAANAFLATSISFANEISDLSQDLGADAATVFEILKADSRIGRQAYLRPGLGFGGHCLPKDTAALEYTAGLYGRRLLQLHATRQVNQGRIGTIAAWLRETLGSLDGRKVCLAGLAFKPGTDDLRESQSINLGRILALEGAIVTGWDPILTRDVPPVRVAATLEEALEGADALVIANPWSGASDLDPLRLRALMATPVLFDAPALLPAAHWQAAGFITNRSKKGPQHAFDTRA
jgi:UDPglucose 6-dehydrogenase